MGGAFKGIHLELQSTTDVLDEVQHVAEDVGRTLGLDQETLHWTCMAVRESVINAITHGNHNNPRKCVFVDFSVAPAGNSDDLIVTVRDEGDFFDPDTLGDPLAPENVLKTSGRGIFLIRQFMDDVSIRRAGNGGTEVRMIKHL